MLLKKYVKNRRKLKILLLLMVVGLIVVSLIVLSSSHAGPLHMHDEQPDGQRNILARRHGPREAQPLVLVKSPLQDGVIMPEKYDERKIRERLANEKLQQLREHKSAQANEEQEEEERISLEEATKAIHIYYNAPVQWYKTKKSSSSSSAGMAGSQSRDDFFNASGRTTHRPAIRILNTAFYPAMGLYKSTENLLLKHFENIANCGIGVLILSLSGRPADVEVHKRIMDLVPRFNMSVTFELSVAGNQSYEFVQLQLRWLQRYAEGYPEAFYRVFSLSHRKWMPVVYVSNAYKLSEQLGNRMLCRSNPDTMRRIFDGFFIGHIRLKGHAEQMRRLCFDGIYSKLPSNGATFASTWKNWSYLKSFALTYKMLFVPTVGPGFAERNKFPRHGDIQRHRSNGRYYGVAWRTAILNHVGFINVASYNNWPDGSQIEEVIPKPGFLDYNPGSKTKYLDLTSHWVGNFWKTRRDSAVGGSQSCYEFINNTIC